MARFARVGPVQILRVWPLRRLNWYCSFRNLKFYELLRCKKGARNTGTGTLDRQSTAARRSFFSPPHRGLFVFVHLNLQLPTLASVCIEKTRNTMVYFFRSRCGEYTIYMGKDKFENEDLIKYGLPEDVVRSSPSSLAHAVGVVCFVIQHPHKSFVSGVVVSCGWSFFGSCLSTNEVRHVHGWYFRGTDLGMFILSQIKQHSRLQSKYFQRIYPAR